MLIDNCGHRLNNIVSIIIKSMALGDLKALALFKELSAMQE